MSQLKTNEWVQAPHEGQKWTGQERNFIHDLCKRHDGIQMQWPKPQTGADGIKGPSPLWDEGNIMSYDADLQKLMSWVEQNKHDVESYFRSDFRVYSKDENGKQGQSDGNQILSNINAKIAGKSLELSEFGPAERYIRTGNTITTANSRTGSVRSTLSLGGDKTATVNNHFNADGSQGQVKASGTVNGVKFKASNNITGTAPKASASARGITINASKKVREETEYSDKQIKMAFGILNDPRYRDGNYDGAYATIEKVAKGLARHPSVRNALKRANESVSEDKKDEANDLKGFDAKTEYALKKLQAKYPHSDNLMSALMSELEKAQIQGKSNDAESSMNDNEHDSRIDAVQDKLNSVIAKNNLKENNPITGEVVANDLRQKATRVIEKAKWQLKKEK